MSASIAELLDPAVIQQLQSITPAQPPVRPRQQHGVTAADWTTKRHNTKGEQRPSPAPKRANPIVVDKRQFGWIKQVEKAKSFRMKYKTQSGFELKISFDAPMRRSAQIAETGSSKIQVFSTGIQNVIAMMFYLYTVLDLDAYNAKCEAVGWQTFTRRTEAVVDLAQDLVIACDGAD
ncbi:MAG: hypothetical protein ABIR91_01975, partial [Candidatus Saccharimonadales bacterium]